MAKREIDNEMDEDAIAKAPNKKDDKEKKRKEKLDKKNATIAANAVVEEEEAEVKSSKIVIALVTMVIVVIWLAIIALLIRWDVGGFGSSVLTPVLKDVPYINKILPDTKVIVNDPSSEYTSLDKAIARIKEQELEIAQAKKISDADLESMKEMKSEIERLQLYEQTSAELEKMKKSFYEEVVFSDQAPDIKEYQKYYESIDPAYAEELYKQVVQQEEVDKKIEEYAATYASMKPKEAAAIMEQMTDNLKLVADILQNMSTAKRAGILGVMDSKVAASVTKLMEP